jgi:hypothetical protein
VVYVDLCVTPLNLGILREPSFMRPEPPKADPHCQHEVYRLETGRAVNVWLPTGDLH